MKFIILVATVLATASASWEPIHGKYHGPLHYPTIHKGVPVEPAAVQHAREAHLKALFDASHDNAYQYHEQDNHHSESGHKWHGPLHYPKIYKGVPVEPKEVQHAREAHLSALAHAAHDDHHYEHNHGDHSGYDHNDGHYEEEHQKKWHGPLHYPKIHKGVPVEPKEVQHAREAHLNALSHASHNGHYDYNNNNQHYRKRRGASSYVHLSSKIEHEVPVYHHEDLSYASHKHDDHVYEHHDYDHNDESGHKWHGPLHYPKIYKGVPVEPKEVQHAREAHLNALAHASHDDHHYEHNHENNHNEYDHNDGHYEEEHQKKWHGPLHYPKIHKGVPVEPKEVQHAREAHLSALAHASHDDHHYEHNHENNHNEYDHNDGHYEEEHQKKWHGPLHYPKIHKGVPVEPKEVQHAREAHLNALSHASHNEHYNHNNNNQHYRKRRGASSYVHLSSKIEHEVPVYHHEDLSHASHKHDDHVYEHHDYDHNDESGHKWHGPLHYPKIYKGVPVEPKEVQHAREAHLSALAHASHDDHHYEHNHENNHNEYNHNDGHYEEEHQKKWHGPLHYPKIHKGVPVEPKEVQHAREAHLNALAHASHDDHHYEHNHENNHNEYDHNDGHYEEEHQKKWHGPLHYPKIHKGVPVEPKEVQHAKEAHFAAHAAAKLKHY